MAGFLATSSVRAAVVLSSWNQDLKVTGEILDEKCAVMAGRRAAQEPG